MNTKNCFLTRETPRMEFQLVGSGRRGTRSPRMRNAPLTHHIPAASPATSRFLCQIAILGSNVSVYFWEETISCGRRRTYGVQAKERRWRQPDRMGPGNVKAGYQELSPLVWGHVQKLLTISKMAEASGRQSQITAVRRLTWGVAHTWQLMMTTLLRSIRLMITVMRDDRRVRA